jgi:hypothetical protein
VLARPNPRVPNSAYLVDDRLPEILDELDDFLRVLRFIKDRAVLPFLCNSRDCFSMPPEGLQTINFGQEDYEDAMQTVSIVHVSFLLVSAVGPALRRTLQLYQPQDKALELVFDSLALLVSLSAGSRGRSIETYAVVFDERTNASRTQFERRKSVG